MFAHAISFHITYEILFVLVACSLSWDPAFWRNAPVHRGQSWPRCEADMSRPRNERAVHLAERSKGTELFLVWSNWLYLKLNSVKHMVTQGHRSFFFITRSSNSLLLNLSIAVKNIWFIFYRSKIFEYLYQS